MALSVCFARPLLKCATLRSTQATLHPHVAEFCIQNKTNLITASYVSPEIQALDERCKAAGMKILNEVGVDPGMDHMSAMKIIDDIKGRGGEVKSFSSVCGGLPAPEGERAKRASLDEDENTRLN